MKKIFIIGLVFAGYTAGAQDIHFAQVKNMQKWYNAAMKSENDERNIALDYRNISYKGLIAFKSMAAIADIPLVGKAARQSDDKKGYLGVSGGFAVDQSNQGILRNTTALLGVSYHLPVDLDRTTFISMGVQGSGFQSRINMNGVTTPDQFDKYGMVNYTPDDPSLAGKVDFFSLNAGVSVSHEDEKKVWYVGASARHANRPRANLEGNAEYRLPVTASFQGGYKKISGSDSYGVDVFTNFKAKAYEHLATVYYNYTFDLSEFDGAFGVSFSYRYDDAVIPGLQLQVKKTAFSFNYDIATGNKNASVNRTGFELGLKQIF
ncbi:MAG: PorP/SprF family type IX secretion system membrane protein [Chitinophagaceae bacterium]|nr:PorP/SprF family type IX secretion system membrane protein [Chitinophagaceae bacterium]